MACSECRGYAVTYCPICSPEPTMVKCTVCDGRGRIPYGYDMETGDHFECTEEEYDRLPKDEDEAMRLGETACQGVIETCEVCHGEGKVEYEEDYEPDYED